MIHSRFVAVAVLLAAATPAVAAPPGPPNGPCQCASTPAAVLEQVDHAFIGDIIELKGSGDEIATAVIRVRETLKGGLTGVVQVRDTIATDCAWSVFEMAGPGRYVVFANNDEGDLVTPAFCPQTQPFNGWKDRVAAFRAAARPGQAAKPTAVKKPATDQPAPKPAS